MPELILEAKNRTELGKKNKALRKQGLIPACVYGYKTENKNITVDAKHFHDVFGAAGSSALVNLKIESSEPEKVLILEPQIDSVSGKAIHVDFYKVRMDQKIKTEVPLKFIGIAPAVKELEGTLIKNKDSFEIECLPADLIHEIRVNVSPLKTFEDQIQIKDISIPANITVLAEPEEVVALVNPPRSEEELEALEEEVTEDVEGVEVAGAKPEEEAEEAAGTEGEEPKKQPLQAPQPSSKDQLPSSQEKPKE